MAESVPAITLTDPNNEDAAPTPAMSPAKDASREMIPAELNGIARDGSGRPATPSKTSSSRPDSSTGWASPGRLVRRLSNGNTNASSGPAREEQHNGNKDGQQEALPAMDPLSQHIFKRTGAPVSSVARPKTADSGLLNGGDGKASVEQSSAPAVQPPRRTETQDGPQASHTQKDLREGVKAVSFMSRLMRNKKKEEDVPRDEESVSNEGRPEGTDAEVFAQPVDYIGYSPRQPQPPAYIKMRSKNKKTRDFDRVFLAQQLECRKRRKVERQNGSNRLRRKSSTASGADTVWAMEFSRDGKYLAAAGADGIVRLWAVLSSSEDRQKHEKQESCESEANGASVHAGHLSAPVFQSKPVQEYEGHTSTVLDLSWSKNNFLLSSSMDKTVRLWHVSRAECLCTFKHSDFVPSIAFHPKDDRFFLAGSLDSKIRLWSIPDKNVAYTAQVPDMITAVAFTPDGKNAIAGCLSGLCMFYETEGMKYQSQVHVRSTRGQNARGSKIAGISAYHDRRGDIKLLITSNDSRIRFYNLRDKNLELKFRGNENNCSQIRATMNDDGRYVVCGSEDRKAYIWSMGPADGDKRDRKPVEMFEAHDTITTSVCFAPAKTRQLLSSSEDPVYDMCNPPPVTLMSRAERAESQSSSTRPPTETGSVQATPAGFESKSEKPEESASYLKRSGHRDGNIIVTADFSGNIKVFRQDCAWSKRKADEWERSSLFSKRTGRLSRNGSVMTRGSQPSLREGRTSLSTTGPSDRILSWRQGVASSPSIAESQHPSSKNTSRSISPIKSIEQREAEQSTVERKVSNNPEWTGRAANVKTSPSMKDDVFVDTAKARGAANGQIRSESPKSARDDNPLGIHNGGSYMFWNTQEWKDRAERVQNMHDATERMPTTPSADANHLDARPPLVRGPTVVSQLSDERSSASDYDDAPEENERDAKCPCGGLSFGTRRTKEGTFIVCTKCGRQA
ncbi:hypothetical protein LTR37_020041 [Vermiconidia calcicola]|uniref:Uncharacterized protein n=1 Tax=Vermiconidia calcicola TaxID=1690605 RepID=A0ACC3MCD2_9PEZI|nr:hypothetical protein LTR37_020041 [Vermiconidia calcicola]